MAKQAKPDGITSAEAMADKLYANTNAKTPAISSSRIGVYEAREPELRDNVGLDTTARAKVRDEVFTAVKDLPDGLARSIADGAFSNIIARSRVVEDVEAADLELDQRIAAQNLEVRKELADRYGDRGEALLKRANRFVTANPKLAEMLRERGLGSRPDIVLELVEQIHLSGWGAKK